MKNKFKILLYVFISFNINGICQNYILNGYLFDNSKNPIDSVIIQIPKLDQIAYSQLNSGYFELIVPSNLLKDTTLIFFSKKSYISKFIKIGKPGNLKTYDLGDIVLYDNDPLPGFGKKSGYIKGKIFDISGKNNIFDFQISSTVNSFRNIPSKSNSFVISIKNLLPNEKYFLWIQANGFKPDTLNMNSNQFYNLNDTIFVNNIYLESTPPTIYSISSKPPNADIFINGIYQGNDWPFKFKISYNENPPNLYTIDLRKNIYLYYEILDTFKIGSDKNISVTLFNRTPYLSIKNYNQYAYSGSFNFDFSVPLNLGLDNLNYLLAVEKENKWFLLRKINDSIGNKGSPKISLYGMNDTVRVYREGCYWINGKITINIDTLKTIISEDIQGIPINFYILNGQMNDNEINEYLQSSFKPCKVIYDPGLSHSGFIEIESSKKFINNSKNIILSDYNKLSFYLTILEYLNIGLKNNQNYSCGFSINLLKMKNNNMVNNLRTNYGYGTGINFSKTINYTNFQFGYFYDALINFYDKDINGSDQFNLVFKGGVLWILSKYNIKSNININYFSYHTNNLINNNDKISTINMYGCGLKISKLFKSLLISINYNNIFINQKYSEINMSIGYHIFK